MMAGEQEIKGWIAQLEAIAKRLDELEAEMEAALPLNVTEELPRAA